MISRNTAGTVAMILTSLCLVAYDSPLAGQDVGHRVRVTVGGDLLTGDVVEKSDAGFTLALSGEELIEVPNGEVEKLEVRTCCIDHAWAYPVVAGVTLGGVGAAYFTDGVVCTDTTTILGRLGDPDACDIVGNGFWWGVLGGGVAGLAVGMTFFREKWEIISFSDSSGPKLSPLLDIGTGPDGTATMILGARIRLTSNP